MFKLLRCHWPVGVLQTGVLPSRLFQARRWETSQHDNHIFLPLCLYDTLMYNEKVTYSGSSGVVDLHKYAVTQHVFTWQNLHKTEIEMQNVALMIPGGFVTVAVSHPQNTEPPSVCACACARAFTSAAL